ncbi:MAG TPA: pseudaminic acid biosynthesis-associated methylase [Terriglobales bacterium]|nr:pseudaminic acid biosynthesis-associated methylase [Terriglobales bacterium]
MNSAKASSSQRFQPGETAQTKVWKGKFGREYTDRNVLGSAELDSLWLKNYGVSRSEISGLFLCNIDKRASILEVGCNIGNQLLMLQSLGYTNLTGIEIQSYALNIAKPRVSNVALYQGSALALPFESNSFDLVFTAGVLIHIAAPDLPQALNEIHRCAKQYIWGTEYFSSEPASVFYHGRGELLWKMDYAKLYLSRFPDLNLVREERLKYLQTENIDSIFLLRKRETYGA